MLFEYKASTKEGDIQEGTVEARSRKTAVKELRSKGLLVISVQAPGEKEEEKKGIEITIPFIHRVSSLDKVLFARHLGLMIKAGLDLLEALEALKEQTGSKKLKKILGRVIESVAGGNSLSESLSNYPKIFDDLFLNIIKVGEEGGTLDESLDYLATTLEKDYSLKRKVRGAMMYPIIILAATLALGISISIFVLPKLVRVFKSLNVELPLPTRILISFSEFMTIWGVYVGIGLIIFIVAFRYFLKLKFVRPYFHKFIISLPAIGKISKHVNLARSTRTLGVLLKSGIPIVEALEITSKSLENEVYMQGLSQATEEIKKGGKLSDTLEYTTKSIFPVVVLRMIAVGEKTGNLDDTLIYLANFYEEEVDNATKNLSTIIEPILLIFLGIAVGFVAIAIITPIYSLTGAIR